MDKRTEHPLSHANLCLATACDEALVAAAKHGQHSAYSELCSRHSKRTLRTVQRITRNAEDAEDVVQESLMKAYLGLENFDGRAAFSSWLTRIAINSALMTLRRRRNRPESSLDSIDDSGKARALELIATSCSPEDRILQHERKRRLHSAVSRLPPNLRSVMEIRQSHDGSLEEIADLLGISVSATKSRVLRAKAALRISLTTTT